MVLTKLIVLFLLSLSFFITAKHGPNKRFIAKKEKETGVSLTEKEIEKIKFRFEKLGMVFMSFTVIMSIGCALEFIIFLFL